MHTVYHLAPNDRLLQPCLMHGVVKCHHPVQHLVLMEGVDQGGLLSELLEYLCEDLHPSITEGHIMDMGGDQLESVDDGRVPTVGISG